MQKKDVNTLVLLVRAALTEGSVTLPEDFSAEILPTVAKKHHIFNLLLYGAVATGLDKTLPELQKLYDGAGREVFVGLNQDVELRTLCDALEENGIDHMPLKGANLRSLYPRPEMRVMGDADILIRTADYERVAALAESLGYGFVLESNHEYAFAKQGLHVEFHKMLIPSYNKDYYTYFGDGWNRAVLAKGKKHSYRLGDEDEFIYIFTHFAKHYRDAGVGIKHLTDIWVYTSAKQGLDTAYIEGELKKLSLLDFYRNVMKTCAVWFEDGAPDDKTEFITNVIVHSGAFGTSEAYMKASFLRNHAASGASGDIKTHTLARKLFPSAKDIKAQYTYLDKCPVLLPVAWVTRWFDALLHKRKNFNYHINMVKTVTTESVNNYKYALNFVGLDFDFKE